LYKTEPLILQFSCFEVKFAIIKLKLYKFSSIYEILAGLIRGGDTLTHFQVRLNKEELLLYSSNLLEDV